MTIATVFHGNIAYSLGPSELIRTEDAVVGVSTEGRIKFVDDAVNLGSLQVIHNFDATQVNIISR